MKLEIASEVINDLTIATEEHSWWWDSGERFNWSQEEQLHWLMDSTSPRRVDVVENFLATEDEVAGD